MIQVENLIYSYPKSQDQTLKGLNFNIAQGEVFGFLGPSGAGKSTAQKILYKILNGYGGKVLINNKDLKEWDSNYLEKIGVGFELPNHYPKLTGLENLQLFGAFYPKQKLKDYQQLFELVDLENAMHKRVESYSKGMKMRLNFIRAIQHNPDILFLDEPTSGLDPVNAQTIKNHIKSLKAKGKTIFVTTHSMHTADEICDKVAFIVNGEIKANDTPQNLKDKFGKAAVTILLQNGQQQEFNLKALGQNTDFLNFINSGEVKHIQSMEASLEEVFIKITGQSLL